MVRIALCFCATALLAGIAALSGCREPEQAIGDARKPETIIVTTQPAGVQSLPRDVDVVGTLWGDEDVTISAKVPGRVDAVLKDVGDRGAPGEPLARLETIDYDLIVRQKGLAVREVLAKLNLKAFPPADFDSAEVPTVKRARLQAANAEARFQRGRQLHEQTPPLLSDQDFADLQTAWEVARSNYDVELLNTQALLAEADSLRAELELAQQRLMDATVRFPLPRPTTAPAAQHETESDHASFAVSARMVSIGEYVREGTQMFRVVRDDPVKLRASVPEGHVAELQVGQRVRVSVEAYPADEFWGSVSRINPQIDPANRTFEIEALVPNPDRRLKPGAFAKASVQTHIQPKVVLVPHEAVVSFAGVSKVFVVRDGKAAEVLVEPGERQGDLLEIAKGLKGTESLIVPVPGRLASGAPVMVKPNP